MKVVVTGATGLVGKPLVAKLLARGDSVTVLTRDAERAKSVLGTEVTAIRAELETPGPWLDSLAGADALVHLAGELIAGKRWDARQKQIIRDSRIESTRVIVEGLAKATERPKVMICSSAIDYYPFATSVGDFDDDPVTESDEPGDTFLARLCRDLEKEALGVEALGVRLARLRIGIVLAPGPAMAKMTQPFRMYIGGPLGSGQQFFSWVHVDDVVGVMLATLDDARYSGAINLVAGSVRNRDFAKALGTALHKPSWVRVPKFMLKLAVGELAEFVFNGRNVVPKRLDELGYAWQKRELDAALADAVK